MPKVKSCLIFFLASTCLSAQAADPDWPCIQVLVPEIAAAVYWPRPIDEARSGAWRQDESLAALAQRLGELEQLDEPARRRIADFVESLPPQSRADSLDRLADGIITLANQRRTRYLSGIKRYTRQQISIAGQIETKLNELAELEDRADAETRTRRTELEETLHWHQRVYDQRERAIQSLCERPVELEERLSAVLRELASHLP